MPKKPGMIHPALIAIYTSIANLFSIAAYRSLRLLSGASVRRISQPCNERSAPLLQLNQASIERCGRIDNSSHCRPVELIVTLGIVCPTVEVTPFNRATVNPQKIIKRRQHCGHCYMRVRHAPQSPTQLHALVVEFPLRSGPAELELQSAVPTPPQPSPQTIGQAFDGRSRMAQSVPFFIGSKGDRLQPSSAAALTISASQGTTRNAAPDSGV